MFSGQPAWRLSPAVVQRMVCEQAGPELSSDRRERDDGPPALPRTCGASPAMPEACLDPLTLTLRTHPRQEATENAGVAEPVLVCNGRQAVGQQRPWQLVRRLGGQPWGPRTSELPGNGATWHDCPPVGVAISFCPQQAGVAGTRADAAGRPLIQTAPCLELQSGRPSVFLEVSRRSGKSSLSVGTDAGKTHTFPAVEPSTGGNLRNGRSLLRLSQAVGEASIPPFNNTGNTWGPKPDRTRPLRPVNADTFGVTLKAAATGTV